MLAWMKHVLYGRRGKEKRNKNDSAGESGHLSRLYALS